MTAQMPSAGDPEQDRRRARRDFIRTNHPDVGGDHAGFVAGLAELDAEPAPPRQPPRVTVVADQPWPVSLTTSLVRRVRRRKRAPRVR